MNAPIDLRELLLPLDWSNEQLETEARRVFFDDLAKCPPVTPVCTWLESKTLLIPPTEGAFRKIFGQSEGWTSYHHHKTGVLCPNRMKRARWIRPVLEMKVPKTNVYVNRHSMGPRNYSSSATGKRNRIFVTVGTGLLYFVSLVYTDYGLALSTAFEPDGQWLRRMLKKDGTAQLGPK